MYNSIINFKNKKVLITGHTGFKGSWLTTWLVLLGAKVLGISKDLSSKPSHYKELKIFKKITDVRLDIKNLEKLKKIVIKFQPDFVFHLAAQSLVNVSYKKPLNTWHTNLIGTLNILESIKNLNKKCVCVIITSDKCYKNIETKKGYTETDVLGGEDPYSASKAAAEMAIGSYFKSFLSNKKNLRIASARAGNVIGGGDWTKGRLIPDCMVAASKNKIVKIRNLNSTRPWQHVIELLYGYLLLAKKLSQNSKINGLSFNFGPNHKNKNFKVKDILVKIKKNWKNFSFKRDSKKNYKEAKLLALNCQRAKKILNWNILMSFSETVKFTVDWYKAYYSNKKNNNVLNITLNQIKKYNQIINLRRKEG